MYTYLYWWRSRWGTDPTYNGMQASMFAVERSTLTLNPMGKVYRSPNRGIQWSHQVSLEKKWKNEYAKIEAFFKVTYVPSVNITPWPPGVMIQCVSFISFGKHAASWPEQWIWEISPDLHGLITYWIMGLILLYFKPNGLVSIFDLKIQYLIC